MRKRIIFLLFIFPFTYSYGQVNGNKNSTTQQPNDTIAKQKFQVMGGVYDNVNNVPDDDPSGFTQYFASINLPIPFPLSKWHGYADQGKFKFILLRNLYLQGDLNSKVQQLYTDSVNPLARRAINRLDLLQYAYAQATASLNIFTMVFAKGGESNKDLIHLYFDCVGGLMIDSISEQKSIQSNITGLSLSFKTEKALGSPFSLDAGAQLLWINPHSSQISPVLNPQYRELKSDTASMQLPLTANNQVYLHLFATLSYLTSSQNSGYAYVHLSDYTNCLSTAQSFAKNHYLQIQVGYSIDANSLLAKLIPSTASSSSNTATGSSSTSTK